MDLEIDDIIIDVKPKNEFHDSKEILTNYEKLKLKNRSKPIMSKYERTKIIGVRAQQISQGSPPLVEVPKHLSSTLDIATYELKLRKTPFIIKRNVGINIEYWKVEDLIINDEF
jgi:DNA-directed RNA polymerase subunit K/omega|tara:strand:- start:988 stop:1329 length:342 start_codon:yes stop_codon:yes gene_type:complete